MVKITLRRTVGSIRCLCYDSNNPDTITSWNAFSPFCFFSGTRFWVAMMSYRRGAILSITCFICCLLKKSPVFLPQSRRSTLSRLTKPRVETKCSQTRRQNAKHASDPQRCSSPYRPSETPPEHALNEHDHNNICWGRGTKIESWTFHRSLENIDKNTMLCRLHARDQGIVRSGNRVDTPSEVLD